MGTGIGCHALLCFSSHLYWLFLYWKAGICRTVTKILAELCQSMKQTIPPGVGETCFTLLKHLAKRKSLCINNKRFGMIKLHMNRILHRIRIKTLDPKSDSPVCLSARHFY